MHEERDSFSASLDVKIVQMMGRDSSIGLETFHEVIKDGRPVFKVAEYAQHVFLSVPYEELSGDMKSLVDEGARAGYTVLGPDQVPVAIEGVPSRGPLNLISF